jgi:hypothetical protein
MRALAIEPGQRFGRLVTIERVAGSEKRRWRVRCDCGNERAVEASPLVAGITQSCGCLAKERRLVANLRHGDASNRTQAPEYHRYKAMIQRCCNPKHPGFKNYGLRGITVCDRWRFGENGESGYQCFLTDMGRRPSPKNLAYAHNSRFHHASRRRRMSPQSAYRGPTPTMSADGGR